MIPPSPQDRACVLGEGAGNRGNFFLGAAPALPRALFAIVGWGRGLPSQWAAAVLPSAPAPAQRGCRLPFRSPGEKGGSRAGLLPPPPSPPPPFLPGAPSLSPAGRSSPAGERRQAGWTRRRARARPDPSGRPGGRGAWRGSPAPLPRPSPCRSFGPSPPFGAGTAGRNGGKRESFYKGGITDPAGTKEFLFGQSSQRGCGLAAWRPAPPGSPGAGGGALSCR